MIDFWDKITIKNKELDEAFAFTASGKNGIRLTAVNGRARQEGLSAGLSLADAKARLPGLKTLPANPEADRKALYALADWCGRYSPWINTDGPDGLWLDITGCDHLFGGEEGLVEDLSKRLGTLGFTSQMALCDTPGAAHALARYRAGRHRPLVAPAGRTREALVPLPVEALRLPLETSLLLHRLGLKTIGRLYGIPRAALARRFKAATPSYLKNADTVCHRLDQALGLIDEPISPLSPPQTYRTRMNLPDPIATTDSINHYLVKLLDGLAKLLETDQQGARRLTFALYRTDGTVQRLRIASSRPSRDTGHLHHLFKEHIDKTDPGFGIETLILNADRTEPLTARQTALTGKMSSPKENEGMDRLIDRLANRLGPGNVVRISLRASHLPERAQILKTALTTAEKKPAEKSPSAPHPARLLLRPEPIEVVAEVPDGPPLKFTWRRVVRRIARMSGPERIAPEWWTEDRAPFSGEPLTRDYYRIEDEMGIVYWVFRQGLYQDLYTGNAQALPTWFVHGLFT